MVMNVSVQYSGGFLSDTILLTLCYYHRGTRSIAMKSFRLCSLCSHVLVIFSPSDLLDGCSIILNIILIEDQDAFRFFFKHNLVAVFPFSVCAVGFCFVDLQGVNVVSVHLIMVISPRF